VRQIVQSRLHRRSARTRDGHSEAARGRASLNGLDDVGVQPTRFHLHWRSVVRLLAVKQQLAVLVAAPAPHLAKLVLLVVDPARSVIAGADHCGRRGSEQRAESGPEVN
jgi:hypothetical protein